MTLAPVAERFTVEQSLPVVTTCKHRRGSRKLSKGGGEEENFDRKMIVDTVSTRVHIKNKTNMQLSL